MKQVTTGEVLLFNKLLRMEVNGLAMAKAGLSLISDEQLKNTTQAGISATEARIVGLQQFISENNIQSQEGVQ